MASTLENSLSLLKKINQIRIQGRPIYDFYSYKGYSLWSFFQQLIWLEILTFANRQILSSPLPQKKRRFLPLKKFIHNSFIIFSSTIAYLGSLLKKPDIIVFTGDIAVRPFQTDPRIAGIHQYLSNRKIRYIEMIHAKFNRGLLKRFIDRKRMVMFVEIVDILYPMMPFLKKCFFKKVDLELLDLSNFSPEERPLVKGIVIKYSQRAEIAIWKIRIATAVLRILHPSYFFSIDDARYYQELLLACHLAKVESVAFQHGRFNKFLPGWINYGIPPELCISPDRYYVWNDYWKKKIITISPTFSYFQDRIHIGGKATAEGTVEKPLSRIKKEGITILIPHEPSSYPKEISKYIEKFLTCPDISILYQTRKDIPESKQMEAIKDYLDKPQVRVIGQISHEEQAAIDIVVGTYSTLLYEYISLGIPVGILETSSTQTDDLAGEGLAIMIGLNSNICSLLNIATRISDEELKKRSESFLIPNKFEDTLDALIRKVNPTFAR